MEQKLWLSIDLDKVLMALLAAIVKDMAIAMLLVAFITLETYVLPPVSLSCLLYNKSYCCVLVLIEVLGTVLAAILVAILDLPI